MPEERTEGTGESVPASLAGKFLALFTISFWKNWFLRPCGGWEVLRLGTPIVISSGTLALMNFADRLYLTWFDQTGMAAAFQAGTLMWLLTTFPVAIAAYTNAFVSQYNGAKEYRKIGENVWQGVFFGLAAGLIFIAATPLVTPFFRWLGASGEMLKFEGEYWFWLSLGASALIAHEPFTSYFCGRHDMKTVMAVGITVVLVNAALDPLLIFGIHGHLRFGVVGAAIASTISLWFKFFLYLAIALHRDKKWQCGLRDGCRLRLHELGRLARFGSMSAFQVVAENSCYTLFILLMNRYGEAPSAAAAIAFNLDFLVYLPTTGLGIATTALVGNQIGARRPDLASRAVFTTFVLAAIWTGIFVSAFVIAPNFFLGLYAHNNPVEFETIRQAAIYSLRFVSCCLFFDTLDVIFTAALRGAGDTRFIMTTTLIVASFTLTAIVVGTCVGHFGYLWPWSCMACYVTTNATIFLIRFLQGGWRKHSLVEGAAEAQAA